MGKAFRQLGFARIRRDHLLEVLGEAGRRLSVAGTAVPGKATARGVTGKMLEQGCRVVRPGLRVL